MVDYNNSSQKKKRHNNTIDFHVIASTPKLDIIKITIKQYKLVLLKCFITNNLLLSRTYCSVHINMTLNFSELFIGHKIWSNYC